MCNNSYSNLISPHLVNLIFICCYLGLLLIIWMEEINILTKLRVKIHIHKSKTFLTKLRHIQKNKIFLVDYIYDHLTIKWRCLSIVYFFTWYYTCLQVIMSFYWNHESDIFWWWKNEKRSVKNIWINELCLNEIYVLWLYEYVWMYVLLKIMILDESLIKCTKTLWCVSI